MKEVKRPSRHTNTGNGEHNGEEKRSLAIEECLRHVASLLAQSRTEAEIVNAIRVNQATVSRDIQALREESGKFLQELAKSDLVFSYRQSES